MKTNCEGCAACCMDWRSLIRSQSAEETASESPYEPIVDIINFVMLTRDEILKFLKAGYADALTPQLVTSKNGIEIGDERIAAVNGKPVFFIGLRMVPKYIAPFDRDREVWTPTCIFLDPSTLQCRIHESELYPTQCQNYPAQDIVQGKQTECEQVEEIFGGERLLDEDISDQLDVSVGSDAVATKAFTHPRPDALENVIDRMRADQLTAEDRAEFIAIAATSTDENTGRKHFAAVKKVAMDADSWAGRACAEWKEYERSQGESEPAEPLGKRIEDDRGAPPTPGWDSAE